MMLRSKSQVNLGCTEVWQGCLMSQIPKDREKGGSSAHWHKELLLLLPLTEQHPLLPSHHSPMSLHSRNTVFKPTEKQMSCLQSNTISPDSKKPSKQTNKNDQPGDPHQIEKYFFPVLIKQPESYGAFLGKEGRQGTYSFHLIHHFKDARSSLMLLQTRSYKVLQVFDWLIKKKNIFSACHLHHLDLYYGIWILRVTQHTVPPPLG